MTLCYLATSKSTAEDIVTNGFRMSHGTFGYAYNFYKSPKYAYDKASSSNVIIIAKLNTGRCKNEYSSNSDWNLSKINRAGYDSVQNGNEIAVFEKSRIKYSGYAIWDYSLITFNIYDCDFNQSDFSFLTSSRESDLNVSGHVKLHGDTKLRNLAVGRYKQLRNESLN